MVAKALSLTGLDASWRARTADTGHPCLLPDRRNNWPLEPLRAGAGQLVRDVEIQKHLLLSRAIQPTRRRRQLGLLRGLVRQVGGI